MKIRLARKIFFGRWTPRMVRNVRKRGGASLHPMFFEAYNRIRKAEGKPRIEYIRKHE